FDGTDNIQVRLAREARMDAALQAHLCRACGRGLDRTARYLVEFEIVGRAAQIVRSTAFRKRAEATVVQTDVGVVDVPINDVGDRVADRLMTQLVRRGDNLVEIAAFDTEQAHDIRFVQLLART